MNKNDILDYVMNTPGNTNRAVLNSMLNSLEETDGEGSTPSMPIVGDGKTRLYVTVASMDRPDISIYIGCTVVGGVTIDWGDGSNTEVTISTERTMYSHSYSAAGDYIIALEITEGELILEGEASNDRYAGITLTEEALPYNCNILNAIEIGERVTSIGAGAFTSCEAMTSVVIPEGVTSIGEVAFVNCRSLTSVVIPDSVTSIGNGAFVGCISLTSVTIPSSVTSIEAATFLECSALTSVVIPEGVTSIGGAAFSNCEALTSVVIPSSVTSIGASAFNGCNLKTIVIPDSVTSIGDGAFNGCAYLTSVVIPEGIGAITNEMFMDCGSLGGVHLLSSTPPTLDEGSFDSVPEDCKIYIPEGSLEAYSTAANWSDYTSMLRVEGAEPGVA